MLLKHCLKKTNHSRTNNVSSTRNNFNPTNRPGSKIISSQPASQNTNRDCPRVTCKLCDNPGNHVKQSRKFLQIHSLINGYGYDGQTRNNAPSQTQQQCANYATHSTSTDENWLIDFGASHHVTRDLHNLSPNSYYDCSEDIMHGDGKEHKTTHTGSACIPSYSWLVTISNVLCLPMIKKNIISVH